MSTFRKCILCNVIKLLGATKSWMPLFSQWLSIQSVNDKITISRFLDTTEIWHNHSLKFGNIINIASKSVYQKKHVIWNQTQCKWYRRILFDWAKQICWVCRIEWMRCHVVKLLNVQHGMWIFIRIAWKLMMAHIL